MSSILPVIATLIGFVLLLGLWISGEGLTTTSERVIAAVSVTAVLVVWGLRLSWARLGRLDLLHPLVFGLIYTAVAFIAPIWAAVALDSPYGALRRPETISTSTIALMILGLFGYAIGSSLRFKNHTITQDFNDNVLGARLRGAGRILLVPVLVWNGFDIAQSGVARVGEAQTTQTIADSFGILVGFAFLVGTLLILVGNKQGAVAGRILSGTDLLFVGMALASQALTGRRSDAVAVILVILVYAARSRRAFLWVGVGTASLLAFAVWGVRYRSAASGSVNSNPALDLILGDLANISFTTGATAQIIPESVPYFAGSTLVAALVRQLPGPIANAIMGPADDTGTYVFRGLINFANDNHGIGYSIPAEGYLNFGAVGLFVMCLIVGMFASWAYARYEPTLTGATYVVYPLFLANLPAMWRSDALGGIKSVLYPLVIYWLIIQVVRIVSPRDR